MAACVLNSGHNCLSTELIVTARGWPQRPAFLEALRKVLDGLSQRWPWYPNSMARISFSSASHCVPLFRGHVVMLCCTEPRLGAATIPSMQRTLFFPV